MTFQAARTAQLCWQDAVQSGLYPCHGEMGTAKRCCDRGVRLASAGCKRVADNRANQCTSRESSDADRQTYAKGKLQVSFFNILSDNFFDPFHEGSMLGNRLQASISTRTILIGVLIFNIVAIALSEVQRRSLVERAEQAAVNLVQSRNREEALEMDRLQKVVNDLNRQMKEISWSAASLRIIAGNSLPVDKRKLEAQIVDRLNGGKAVVVQFDDDAREDRDKDGRIRCGAGAAEGYLGAFIAGERYTIAYDGAAGQWIGTGAAQTLGFDPASQTCKSSTSTYGRKELKADVPPGQNLVLWGAQFQLDGLDVMRGGRKVGSIAWFD